MVLYMLAAALDLLCLTPTEEMTFPTWMMFVSSPLYVRRQTLSSRIESFITKSSCQIFRFGIHLHYVCNDDNVHLQRGH